MRPCAGAAARLCGEIVEVFGSDRADLVGRTMLRDMAPDGAGRWSGGTIWAPDDDRTDVRHEMWRRHHFTLYSPI